MENTTQTEPVSLSLRLELSRDRFGKINHLAVKGFPIDWSAFRVVDDCRGAVALGTDNEADRAVVEAVDAGHWQFPTSTGGPEWRLFVDEA
jgi:hypothetical protein